jgi:hypothetical protein
VNVRGLHVTFIILRVWACLFYLGSAFLIYLCILLLRHLRLVLRSWFEITLLLLFDCRNIYINQTANSEIEKLLCISA